MRRRPSEDAAITEDATSMTVAHTHPWARTVDHKGRRVTLACAEESPAVALTALFPSVFGAGFECSDHKLEDGRRLDLLGSTSHARFTEQDYVRLRKMGIAVCREGVSWVRSEPRSGFWDFSLVRERLTAARRHGLSLVWDLMHFGFPDDTDPFAPSFPARFARYGAAFARFVKEQGCTVPLIAPINEISFLAWAGGDVRNMNPFASARGVELKTQLVRATIEAIEAIRTVLPRARFLQPEPLIHIVPHPDHPKTWQRVEADNALQFQAWDMLSGRIWPGLGGKPTYLDILGVNFYGDNQFMLDGTTIEQDHPRYKAFSNMLCEAHARYGRPMIVSETGGEGEGRARFVRYVVEECIRALRQGCELYAITLYPIVNHPGWLDERHCENGLWGYPSQDGERETHEALAAQLRELAPRLSAARRDMLAASVSTPV